MVILVVLGVVSAGIAYFIRGWEQLLPKPTAGR